MKININYKLTSKDELTELVKSHGVNSWYELIQFVINLPYGRTKNRTDLRLVLSEKKGTCSSKHALLKSIADLNDVPNIDLVIGIYRMTESNTPNIGAELTKNSIKFIPEAHCYLKINGSRMDFTTAKSEFKKIEKDIIEEKKITSEQVAKFKVDYHKNFLKNWLIENKLAIDFQELWEIREKCIENLTN